jgi:NAD(P)-dependent dehydrogenase (short-subunit alcohol dehydrogenase family)
MSVRDLSGTTAIVTGASRGFGRATAISLAELGAQVVGVARSQGPLEELRGQLGSGFTPEVADVSDPALPARLISLYRPQTLVLNAGATPMAARLQEQTWETFSANWNVDVQHVFNFAREALTAPLEPGSVVVSLSSGVVLRGSAMSGGYAGAKSTIRFISSYAGTEAQGDGSNVRFVAVMPQLTPATELGRIYTELYAAQAGVSVEQFLEQRFGGALTAEQAGKSIADVAVDDSYAAAAYVVTSAGLRPVD